MNAPVDNASQRNALASYRDSGELDLTRATKPIDQLLLRDAGKGQVCTAGRVNDDGGPLPDVTVEPSQAKSSVVAQPSHPVISAEHFVQTGRADDPHGQALANAVDHSLQGERQHRHASARRQPHATFGARAPGKPAAGRPATQPARQAASKSVHAGDAVAKAVHDIVKKAGAETDSKKALDALNKAYTNPKTPQKVKDAILHDAALKDSDVQEILKRAAADATKPLDATTGPTQQHTHDAALNLEQATWRLDPELAGAVVSVAMPAFEAFYEDNEKNLPGDGLFGPAGRECLDKVIAHIAGSRHSDDVTTRFITMGVLSYDRDRAVNDVLSAIKILQDTKTQQTSHRNAAAKAQLRDGSLQHKVDAAKARLDAVITAEIAGKVSLKSRPDGSTPEEIAKQAGKEIVAGYADESQELVSAAVGHARESRRAKAETHATQTPSP